MKVELLHFTPISVIAEATAMPYQSNPSEGLVQRVWASGHRSVARHGMAVFNVEGVSQSLLRQISRHPHINLTVKSSRYCDMTFADLSIPPFLHEEDAEAYKADMEAAMEAYAYWNGKGEYTPEQQREISKLLLPLASQTDFILSGNYQALYEMLQLRVCQRAEWEIRDMANWMVELLRDNVPTIFCGLDCKAKELGFCPEAKGCGRYPKR